MIDFFLQKIVLSYIYFYIKKSKFIIVQTNYIETMDFNVYSKILICKVVGI